MRTEYKKKKIDIVREACVCSQNHLAGYFHGALRKNPNIYIIFRKFVDLSASYDKKFNYQTSKNKEDLV